MLALEGPFGQWLLGFWVSKLGCPLDNQLAAALVRLAFGLPLSRPGDTNQ